MDGERLTVELGDAQLSITVWGPGPPDIVLAHDGLGSVSLWRSVPAQVAAATGRTVMAYDRPGHGTSTPTPSGPWPTAWLHHEADRLQDLLDAVGATDPLLVGLSDGGSIVLLHAARQIRARAILALAPHSWVEPAAVDEIERLKLNQAAVVAGLARHHDHPEALFRAWSEVWTSRAFADAFDLRAELRTIAAPTHIVQGTADEFATDAQAIETAAAVGPADQPAAGVAPGDQPGAGVAPAVRLTMLPDVRHLMHHDDPDLVVQLIAAMDDQHPPQ
jgi:pimeloyl-ACP methyl ester carboxylesterase